MRVLITGGSSGIGLACARAIAADGGRVALVARGEEGLAAAADELPGDVIHFVADVGNPWAIKGAIDQAALAFGGLDVVIANAGAAVAGPFDEMTPDDFERTVRTTLLGVMNTTHAALPHLAATQGTLAVTGSIAGRIATPWLSTYAAAKHGVRGFVRSLRVELVARRIPVNVTLVSPGPVNTPFWMRARTTDGRLPPEIRGAYRADDAAAEVLRAIRHPQKTERTLGGLMMPWIALESLFPNLTLRPMGPLARLGWRKRHKRPVSSDDGLVEPVSDPHVGGDLPARPAAITRLRDVRDRARERAPGSK